MSIEEWSREQQGREHSTAEGCIVSIIIGALIIFGGIILAIML